MGWLVLLLALNTAASLACGLAFYWWSKTRTETRGRRVCLRTTADKWAHVVLRARRTRRAQCLHGIYGTALAGLSTAFRLELSAVCLGHRRRHGKA